MGHFSLYCITTMLAEYTPTATKKLRTRREKPINIKYNLYLRLQLLNKVEVVFLTYSY